MIVDSALYRAGVRTDTVADPGDLAALRSHAVEPGDFVWVGVFEPSDAELEDVGRVFGLHPLALEDARESHQRPKLETYGDCLFLVLKTLWYVDEEDAVETGEVNLFIGPDFVVSVRHGDGAELRRVRERVEAQPHVLTHGPSAVAWAVCDVAVDDYLDVTDELVTDVDEVEESVFSTDRTQDSTRIYTLKRELAEVRRAVHPLSEPMRRLASGEVPGVHEQVRPFFRDVLDHIQHTGDVVESLESLLSSAFDAHQLAAMGQTGKAVQSRLDQFRRNIQSTGRSIGGASVLMIMCARKARDIAQINRSHLLAPTPFRQKALARKDRPAKPFELLARGNADHPIILRPLAKLIGQKAALNLIDAHNRTIRPAFGKKTALGREIAAHAIMAIQMIGREIGENRDIWRQGAGKIGLIA